MFPKNYLLMALLGEQALLARPDYVLYSQPGRSLL